LDADPDMLLALEHAAFIERGLALVDGPECPLCDHPWPSERHLRQHLDTKLEKSKHAQKLQTSLLANGAVLARETIRVAGLLEPVQRIATAQEENKVAQLLADWKVDLESFKSKLASVGDIAAIKSRLLAGWLAVPVVLSKSLAALD